VAIASASTGQAVAVLLVGLIFIVARCPLARLFFGAVAYMNDPRAGGKRWARENAVLRPALEWFFGLAGVAFIAYAVLDQLGVISLGS
jgi:hypothetical protein